MGKKATKATRKFAASGQLKKQIQDRRRHQQIKKRTQAKHAVKQSKAREHTDKYNGEEDDENGEKQPRKKSVQGMSVDDFLAADFMDSGEGSASEDFDTAAHAHDDKNDEDIDIEAEEDDDNQSFASLDDLDDEAESHVHSLKALAQNDPDFYKYLQENDRELLEFDPDAPIAENDGEVVEDGDVDMEEEDRTPVLTLATLRGWQRGILEHRSLRALRKLLVAFRSAAHMNEDDKVLAWAIDSPSVYHKVIATSLKYAPIVLLHHIPFKELPDGKFKAPPNSRTFSVLSKLLASHLSNLTHLLASLPSSRGPNVDEDEIEMEGEEKTALLKLALSESARLLPWMMGARKSLKAYLKKCLEIWATADDNSVRVTAFLAIRKLASAADESALDMVLKGVYLTLVRASKSPSPHAEPALNLMKNSASELFAAPDAGSAAYQLGFGYIRQLAILLRAGMKAKTKEAHKEVYNWQYVHCVDFWSIVLAKACDVEKLHATASGESELKPLVYPLVQVTLGALKLVPNARSHPLHLHLLRSLLHLTSHTQAYVPLGPHFVTLLTSTLSSRAHSKSSTLRPPLLASYIRIPAQYAHTDVYANVLAEESTFALTEWLTSPAVHGSVAFPELVVPLVVGLRRALKAAGRAAAKEGAQIKALLERVEESGAWVRQRRANVRFAPGDLDRVDEWEQELRASLGDAPLLKYLKVQRKAREKRMKLMEKARDGEGEILDD